MTMALHLTIVGMRGVSHLTTAATIKSTASNRTMVRMGLLQTIEEVSSTMA